MYILMLSVSNLQQIRIQRFCYSFAFAAEDRETFYSAYQQPTSSNLTQFNRIQYNINPKATFDEF